ncbi:hypothetical protein HDC34_001017 [Pseudoclavibacter sp. JAI123]|uniref:hypothetical protein n=1 Tax=Pseudoclavibacter sp. JAI123 TaxID=2723065 RepID=UPI0015CC1272|nr:hypothetical protein [Pseudoclavibacter sp. JAI123]NYF12723.1 hypothetical protein [Pseudoclavibacter sp. JAI123]
MTPTAKALRTAFAASAALAASLLLAGCGGDEVVQSPISPDTGVPTSTTEETANEDDTMTVSPNPNNTESTTDSPTPSETMSPTTTP